MKAVIVSETARSVTGWLVADAGDVTQGAQLAKAV
jgi:hypothetical protein